jgi:plastocyanin
LELKGTAQGGLHPAHIHFNTAAEGGDIALTLKAVDGATGKSTTTFTTLDNGTAITYQALLGFDGYINVHMSADKLSTLVAQGDIGQNELTGRKTSYVLASKDVATISGNVEFAERINKTTLVTIKLNGTTAGESPYAHIHINNVATSGAVIADLIAVNGETGISKTQLSALNSGEAITYTQFLTLNAYINVHKNSTTIIAQGNIGSNVGTGAEANTYTIINSGSTAYIFNGGGFTNANNPSLTFKRGATYTFNVNATGHPFYINSANSTGQNNAYSSGVTRNGSETGTITFTVPMNAPNTLYYNCEFHSSMNGRITITD